MDNLSIETPEQIRLEFPLAGVGSRFLAIALDTLIQAALLAVLWIAGIAIFAGLAMTSARGTPWALAILLVLVFLLQFAYFAFFEAIWNGQTPGKCLMHLRVIKDTGRPLTAYDAAARNLLRIVDSLPGIYAVGIVSAFISPHNKRLGDYVAGTVVVHERPLAQPGATGWDFTQARPATRPSFAPGSVLGLNPAAPQPNLPSGYDAGRLSPEEFGLIETFLLRRRQLDGVVRTQMAGKILDRISARLEIRPEDHARPETLLEKLAVEYRNRSAFR